MNNTQVIHARLFFFRESGARVEVFLLSPESPKEIVQAMVAMGECVWECMVGNKKRWRDHETLCLEVEGPQGKCKLQAAWVDRDRGHVRFTWNAPELGFGEVLSLAGKMPLPPYIQRMAQESDEDRYQTVFAELPGAVAAPTAGLHYTAEILTQVRKQGIQTAALTLHVGAGTFQPVKADRAVGHDMHAERVVISRETLTQIAEHDGPIVAVGTTSLRVLESLYWLGLKVGEGPVDLRDFFLPQQYPYQQPTVLSPRESLRQLIGAMKQQGLTGIRGATQLFILPGYRFQLVDGLQTNFHMPETTLLMLVAALIGPDWRTVYQEALENEYRFLSYGDTSLLIP